MKSIIQVAGIRSLEEAQAVIDCGIKYLGFPLRLDIHTPDLTEEEASRTIRSLGKRCKSVLITYLNKAREITEFSEYLGTNYVQLHGPVRV